MKLEALKTRNDQYFVFFHEYYGAYFNSNLSAFTNNPLRVEAVKEWNWARENWDPTPEIIKLDEDVSERLLCLVEKDPVNGLENIRDLARAEYSETSA